MKRILIISVVILLLTGCGGEKERMNDVTSLRNRINSANTISFQCEVTADYGESIYVFDLNCEYGRNHTMKWEVTAPETIAELSGRIINEKGQFIFDQEILLFELLADGQISPIGAPWVLMKAMRSGYLRSCGVDGKNILMQIDDSYSGIQFSVDVWIDQEGSPLRSEIIWQGRRIVSIDIRDFKIL